MDAFSLDQWLILFLAFLLGLFLGMAMLAGGKWKKRYREELRRREALEAEHRQLQDRYTKSEAFNRSAADTPRTDGRVG
jgi:uncharacterized membrane-anchored protein YhcB (DUF1043 family)